MSEKKHIEFHTPFIHIRGNETEGCREFLGIPYAKAERFRYAEIIETYEGTVDATDFGSSCPQYRQYFPQLDNPERLFYHREFREGISFHYDEDCQDDACDVYFKDDHYHFLISDLYNRMRGEFGISLRVGVSF